MNGPSRKNHWINVLSFTKRMDGSVSHMSHSPTQFPHSLTISSENQWRQACQLMMLVSLPSKYDVAQKEKKVGQASRQRSIVSLLIDKYGQSSERSLVRLKTYVPHQSVLKERKKKEVRRKGTHRNQTYRLNPDSQLVLLLGEHTETWPADFARFLRYFVRVGGDNTVDASVIPRPLCRDNIPNNIKMRCPLQGEPGWISNLIISGRVLIYQFQGISRKNAYCFLSRIIRGSHSKVEMESSYTSVTSGWASPAISLYKK